MTATMNPETSSLQRERKTGDRRVSIQLDMREADRLESARQSWRVFRATAAVALLLVAAAFLFGHRPPAAARHSEQVQEAGRPQEALQLVNHRSSGRKTNLSGRGASSQLHGWQ